MDFTTLTQYDLWWIPILGGPHTIFFDQFAQLLTVVWTWLPMLLMLCFMVVRNNETMAQIGVVFGGAVLCFLLTDGLADGIVKPLAMRPRPLNDPEVRPLLTLVAGVADNNWSFFSAHAANTMGIATYVSLLFRSRRATLMLIAWSLLNCWTRIYMCMHYPSDIFVGLVWGGISGTLAYMAYRKMFSRVTASLHFISSQYTRTGYSLQDINTLVNIFILSLIYAVIRSLMMV